MLPLTSCLFATVVAHAFYARHVVYHHLFLVVLVLSLGRYLAGHPLVRLLDAVAAHTAFFAACIDTAVLRARPGAAWFLVAVAGLWLAQRWAPPRRANALHAALHVVATLGMHVWLDVHRAAEWEEGEVEE